MSVYAFQPLLWPPIALTAFDRVEDRVILYWIAMDYRYDLAGFFTMVNGVVGITMMPGHTLYH